MHSTVRVPCASSGSDSVSLDVSGAWGGWGLEGGGCGVIGGFRWRVTLMVLLSAV